MCYKWLARQMSGSSSMALCLRNAHITVDDVRRAMQRRVRAAQCRCAMLSRDVCNSSRDVSQLSRNVSQLSRDVSRLPRDASNSSRDVTHFLHNVVIANFETNGLPYYMFLCTSPALQGRVTSTRTRMYATWVCTCRAALKFGLIW